MRNHTTIRIALTFGVALFVMMCISDILYGQKSNAGDRVLSKVNEENITVSMVGGDEDPENMEKRLAGIIVRKIAILEARSKGIVISEKEIKASFNKGYAPDRDEETLRATKGYIVELQSAVESLERWRKNPDKDEKIFKELQAKFSGRITRADWEALKSEHGKTDKAFTQYSQSVNKAISNLQSKEKMYETYCGYIRDNLLCQKFLKLMPTTIVKEDRNAFIKFLKRKKIEQTEFNALPEIKRRQLKQQYNFQKHIHATWRKYKIAIFDNDLRKKTYDFLGFVPIHE